MFDSSYQVVNQILITCALAIFAVTGFAGVILGVGLNFGNARTVRVLKAMNRWISLRDNFKPMEKPRDIDKAIYKHRRWFGAAFAICGAYTVYMLLFSIDFPYVIETLSRKSTPVFVELFVNNLKWFLVLGSCLALVIGVTMFASSYALSAFDARINRWYSPTRLGERMDKMHLTLDDWTETFPRTIGFLIALGSAAVMIAAIMVWLASN